MSHEVELAWIGGEDTFALDLKHLRIVQDKCNAGPQRVLMRLMSGDWQVDDPLIICRTGLIGAGMAGEAASVKVTAAAEAHGLQHLVLTATLILSAALTGVEGDPVGGARDAGETKGDDALEKPKGVKTESGDSVGSMPTAPAPGSPPETLTP
jgi:hypothetical protein